jgi:hypothetical protein
MDSETSSTTDELSLIIDQHIDIPEGMPSPPVVEHTVYIDSRHRDMTIYTNPFRFTVEFNPLRESTNVGIPISLRDVYLLRFKHIMLPLRLVPFPGDRYFYLRIRELDIPYIYHSNPKVNQNTDILLYNAGSSGPNLYLECRSDIRFPNNAPIRLQTLTFEFLNIDGEPLVAVSNANEDDFNKWHIVFPHLFSDSDSDSDTEERIIPPEQNPSHTINNVFLEIQVAAPAYG